MILIVSTSSSDSEAFQKQPCLQVFKSEWKV